MEKLKEYKYIILIVLIILGIAFYWFQLRPIQIKKDCSTYLTGQKDLAPDESRPGRFSDMGSSSGKEKYQKCLSEKGL